MCGHIIVCRFYHVLRQQLNAKDIHPTLILLKDVYTDAFIIPEMWIRNDMMDVDAILFSWQEQARRVEFHLASRIGDGGVGAGVGRFQVLTSLHKGSNAWVNENNPSSRTSQLSLFLKELHHAHDDDDDTQLYLLSIFSQQKIICASTPSQAFQVMCVCIRNVG